MESRFGHVKFDEESIRISKTCGDLCEKIEAEINKIPGIKLSEPGLLALQRLEEVHMWLGKALRNAQKSRDIKTPRPTLTSAVVIKSVKSV